MHEELETGGTQEITASSWHRCTGWGAREGRARPATVMAAGPLQSGERKAEDPRTHPDKEFFSLLCF